MKVTRLGPPRAILNSGFGNSYSVLPAVGASGTVLTSTGSNGSYWGENVARITSNGSNALLGPYVNFASGSNTIFSVSSNTLNIAAVASAGASTFITSNGSNSLSGTIDLQAGIGIALGVSGQTITITNTGVPGPAGSGGGGSSVTVPVIIQTKFAGASVSSITLDTTPSTDDRIILVLDGYSTGQATAVSSTNTTWTQIKTFNNAGGEKAAIWIGVCAASPGTAITVTHPNGFMSIRAVVIADTLAPTLGQSATAERTIDATLTGVTIGRLIIVSGGTTDTGQRSLLAVAGFVPVGIVSDVVPVLLGYALATRIDAAMHISDGAMMLCEVY